DETYEHPERRICQPEEIGLHRGQYAPAALARPPLPFRAPWSRIMSVQILLRNVAATGASPTRMGSSHPSSRWARLLYVGSFVALAGCASRPLEPEFPPASAANLAAPTPALPSVTVALDGDPPMPGEPAE